MDSAGFARCGSSIRCPPGTASCNPCASNYHLLERGAHTALGDVFTVANLCATVLRPIAEQRGLVTWEQLAAYAAEEWYPSRIAFGKHKGRSIAEARTDAGLRRWLGGLAQSANARNARMGRWHLRSLEEAAEPSGFIAWECARDPAAVAVAGTGLGLYVNPEMQRLRALVDTARARLFARLREHFQRRDRLRLVIDYRWQYLESRVRQGEEEAGKIAQEYRQASARNEQEYAETTAALAEKQETYHKLTAAINHAKDHGDLATLRRIAEDPHGARLDGARLGRGARDCATAPVVGEHRVGNRLRAGGDECAQGEHRRG